MTDTVLQDVRYALRWLWRSPGFAAVAVLSLGLGIGANAAIFSVVDALLLRPLPVTAPDQLVNLYSSGGDGDTYATSSVPDLQDLRDQNQVFEGLAGYSMMFAAVERDGRPRLTLGEIVSGNYFSLLGVPAALGRTLQPADDAAGAPRAVVLSSRFWRREFGGDQAIVGKTLTIRTEPYTIVGVLGEQFTGMVPMLAAEIWTPVRYVEDIEPAGYNDNEPSPSGTTRLDRRGMRWLFVKGRLKPGVTLEQARANVDVIAAQLREAYPISNKERKATLRMSSETRIHPDADGLVSWIVTGAMAAVGLVLLIACANVAGMLLARATARQREISIRLAIGASRKRLVQQLLTESVVLGTLGATVGVLLAAWTTRLLSTFTPPIPIPISLDLRLDARVLLFTAVVAMLTGIVAGLVPALRATKPNLVADLRGEMQRERVAGRRWSLRDALVIGQIAVTVVLLVVAGLLVRSVLASQHADVGFRTAGLALVSGDTDMLRYTPERTSEFWKEAERRVRALPGVDSVAFASRFPFSINFNRETIAIPGRQKSPNETGAPISAARVSPDYFSTLGISVLQGRAFQATDLPDRPAVVIINQTMARRYWPDENAVGKVVFQRTLDSGRRLEIVGVVADHRMMTVGEGEQPGIFFSLTQSNNGYRVLAARTRGDAAALVSTLRTTLHDIEPRLVMLDQQTMEGQVNATLFPVRIAAMLVAVFSALALLLAAIGLYGVIAFSVARRTREIGIRMAIGARPAAVLTLILRQGLMLAGIGLLAGALLAALATRAVAGALFGITAADAVAWSTAVVTLLGIAIAANLLPAWRAARIDPVKALKRE